MKNFAASFHVSEGAENLFTEANLTTAINQGIADFFGEKRARDVLFCLKEKERNPLKINDLPVIFDGEENLA